MVALVGSVTVVGWLSQSVNAVAGPTYAEPTFGWVWLRGAGVGFAGRPFTATLSLMAGAALAASLLAVPAATAAPVGTNADRQTWQVDGRVNALAYSPDGSVAYIAGTFHHICPPGVAPCDAATPGALSIDNLAAVDVQSGAPIPGWRPQPDEEVSALAVADNGTLYIGGFFHLVGTEVHHRLAALSADTGEPIASWSPDVGAQVKAIALSPTQDIVYIGGSFKTVNQVSRPLLAAVTAYSNRSMTASLLPWRPAPTGSDTYDHGSLMPAIVNALVVRSGDGQVFVGGVFTSIGGLARSDIAAIGPASGGGTGSADAGFDPNPSLHYVTLNVMLTRDGSTLFADGRGPGGFLRAYNSRTGAQLWARRFDGDVQAAVATDSVVYVGGHFNNVAISGSALKDERQHLAAFDIATGATDPWNPIANSAFGVYAMAWSPGHVMVGGDFTKVNYLPHEGFAQFSGGTTSPPTPVSDAEATSTLKGRVDLSWSPVTDADSPTVTYRVYRRLVGRSFDLIASFVGPTGAATPVTYTDQGLPVGSSFQYQVRAADSVFVSGPGNITAPVVVHGNSFGPDSPAEVVASSSVPGVVQVRWRGSRDLDDATLTYTLVRHRDGKATRVARIVGATGGTLRATDTFAMGGLVSYSVTASDGASTSPPSDRSTRVRVARDEAAPATPQQLKVESRSANTVSLTWAASTDADTPRSALMYRVYRKARADAGMGRLIATTAAGRRSFTDTSSAANGVTPDRAYTYYVAASDGPKSSAKSRGRTTRVSSVVFGSAFQSLDGWKRPHAPAGVELDPVRGHLAPGAVRLTSSTTPVVNGYLHRRFEDAYARVCVLEWVSVSSYDTTVNGQTTLVRVYSTSGQSIARLFLDDNGRLWVRSDWGSNPSVTSVTVPRDASWHSTQLCVTTSPDSLSGTLTAWWDGVNLGTTKDVDNSPNLLASMDIGDATPGSYSVTIDDVRVGTTRR